MKNRIMTGLIILSIILVSACTLDDDQQECISGPVGFKVEFIDLETMENLYRNNRFQPSQLQVTDEDNKLVAYRFVTELDKTFIQVNLPFETGETTITMSLDSETEVDFELTIGALRENCTTFYISKLEVPVYGYDEDGTTGILSVWL